MDDSAKCGAGLEVSVSFGRFENDALSWEKWSSFSPNKYLEEVGSLSTPGSVAQKKAYFEAHYKKIAARKLEQEESMNLVIPSPDLSSKEDLIQDSSENGIEFSLCRDSSLVEEVVEEACMTGLTNFVIADDEHLIARLDEHVVDLDSGISAVQETTSFTNANVDDPKLNVSNDAFSVVSKTPRKDLKESPERKNSIKKSSILKKENSKLNSRNIAQKVITPRSKERNLPAVTPRNVKPTSISAHQSLEKKVNSSAKPNIKSSEAVQSKRVAPTSLDMSLSLGDNIPMTRKSLIMESMGDKDIVKRAFKTFQNRTNGFAADEKPTRMNHALSTACVRKISSSRTPTDGNEGLRKETENRASQRSARSNPLSSGLRKSTALDKKSRTLSPATALKSEEKTEKRKEFLNKLGGKSAENTQPGPEQRKMRSLNNGVH